MEIKTELEKEFGKDEIKNYEFAILKSIHINTYKIKKILITFGITILSLLLILICMILLMLL